jgi:hypothetical protein
VQCPSPATVQERLERSAPEHVRPLIVLDMRAADRVPPPRRYNHKLDAVSNGTVVWQPASDSVMQAITLIEAGWHTTRREVSLTEAEVHEPQLLLCGAALLSQQEVLRLHIPVHIPAATTDATHSAQLDTRCCSSVPLQ